MQYDWYIGYRKAKLGYRVRATREHEKWVRQSQARHEPPLSVYLYSYAVAHPIRLDRAIYNQSSCLLSLDEIVHSREGKNFSKTSACKSGQSRLLPSPST
jgi:hypothetical protein